MEAQRLKGGALGRLAGAKQVSESVSSYGEGLRAVAKGFESIAKGAESMAMTYRKYVDYHEIAKKEREVADAEYLNAVNAEKRALSDRDRYTKNSDEWNKANAIYLSAVQYRKTRAGVLLGAEENERRGLMGWMFTSDRDKANITRPRTYDDIQSGIEPKRKVGFAIETKPDWDKEVEI